MSLALHHRIASVVVLLGLCCAGPARADDPCADGAVSPELKSAMERLKAANDALLTSARTEADVKKFAAEARPSVEGLNGAGLAASNENLNCIEEIRTQTKITAGLAKENFAGTKMADIAGSVETTLSDASSSISERLPKDESASAAEDLSSEGAVESISAEDDVALDKARSEYAAATEELVILLDASLDPDAKSSRRSRAVAWIENAFVGKNGAAAHLSVAADKAPLSAGDRAALEKDISEHGGQKALEEAADAAKGKASSAFIQGVGRAQSDYKAKGAGNPLFEKARKIRSEAVKGILKKYKGRAHRAERREALKAAQNAFVASLKKAREARSGAPSAADQNSEAKERFNDTVDSALRSFADAVRDGVLKSGELRSYEAAKNAAKK